MINSEAAAKDWLRTSGHCDDAGFDRLERLVAMLVKENEQQNLVSRGSLAQVWQRHIADSAQLLDHVPRETSPWLDLGTGAGFPGLVIAALKPDIEVVMVESRPRRTDWLSRACAELSLDNTEIVTSRLERVEARQFCAISARAFAPLDRLLSLSARFSTDATIWLLPKGRSAQQELENLRGWRHMFHVEQSVTDAQAGIIVGKLAGRKGTAS